MSDDSSRGEARSSGVVVDLDKLEAQAQELFLHRFIEAVRRVRSEHGRYLTLRAGDELAIRAASDGSTAYLERLTVMPPDIGDPTGE